MLAMARSAVLGEKRRAARGHRLRRFVCTCRKGEQRSQEEREAGHTFAALDSLLRESDFVSLHSPLNPSTRHQIGARELKLMKKTAYLINTARGPIVDEAAHPCSEDKANRRRGAGRL